MAPLTRAAKLLNSNNGASQRTFGKENACGGAAMPGELGPALNVVRKGFFFASLKIARI